MEKISKEELESINRFHREVSNIKSNIADLEISKQLEINKLNYLKDGYEKLTLELSKKYGEGISIDSSTGEIKKNKDGKN